MLKKQSKPNFKVGQWVQYNPTEALGLVVDIVKQDEKKHETRYMMRTGFLLRSVPESTLCSKLSEKQALELKDFLALYKPVIDPDTLLLHIEPRNPSYI